MAKEERIEQKEKQHKPSIKSLWKGKEWYEVTAPALFGEKTITETPSSDPKQLIGRTILSSVSGLTGNPSKYYYKVRLRVTDVNGRKVKTVFDGHECSRDFISRMIRRRSRRIDTRDEVVLQDGKKLIVKLIATTIRPTKTTIASELAARMSSVLKELAAQQTLDSFVKEMLAGNVQKSIKSVVSKIYPLREVEINKTDVVA